MTDSPKRTKRRQTRCYNNRESICRMNSSKTTTPTTIASTGSKRSSKHRLNNTLKLPRHTPKQSKDSNKRTTKPSRLSKRCIYKQPNRTNK